MTEAKFLECTRSVRRFVTEMVKKGAGAVTNRRKEIGSEKSPYCRDPGEGS
ncbi:MAG: hypothetical protein SV686_03605 [Thermodesulfobacteriota bacterium]|nr:hypothetical protein [Thermodesulfobacteriota bacterium]